MTWNISQFKNQFKWKIYKIEYVITKTQNKIILYILEYINQFY